MIRFLWTIALLLVLQGEGLTHELRPGFLEIRQTGSESYDVRFKVPGRGDMRLALYVRLPAECSQAQPRTERTADAFLEHLSARCPGGLAGREVSIDGLAGTLTDVVVRMSLLDGAVQATRLTPDAPYFTVAVAPTWVDTARTYFLLGVQHILLGLDHLLFVLALLLLIRDTWMLVKTITAFTVAHSITLAAAALGWADVAQTPVEAVVALSIAFVAAEVIRHTRHETNLGDQAPWIVAFAFGLLHGLGFGGALKEIGLPQADVPLALLTFNLGVEAGQLLFVFAVLALKASLDRLLTLRLPWIRNIISYGTGSLAAVWFIQRVGVML
jgi:hydrogenase/urease accessory protein HupE